MSHPHVPIVPRMPAASMPATTRSGWATVPASTTVVTPLRSDSSAHSVADVSSSDGECSPCSGTDHSKIDTPGASRSGMQLRTSGSPVKCWWAFTMPGVTTQPRTSCTTASGCSASSALVDPVAITPVSSNTTAPPTSTSRVGVHRDDLTVHQDLLQPLLLTVSLRTFAP